jgi:hypothetical protein
MISLEGALLMCIGCVDAFQIVYSLKCYDLIYAMNKSNTRCLLSPSLKEIISSDTNARLRCVRSIARMHAYSPKNSIR